MSEVIRSDRLDLVALGSRLLRKAQLVDVAGLEAALGAGVGPEWCRSVPARQRLAQLAADPGEHPWLVRAAIHRETRQVVGHVGFHAPPRRGQVEIGYRMMAEHRRRGFALEAARALLEWAHGTGHATTCVAGIRPDNIASRNLISTLGFEHVGQRHDAADGLELVYQRALPLESAAHPA